MLNRRLLGLSSRLKGHEIYAYVVDPNKIEDSETIIASLVRPVAEGIGKIAKPDKIQLVTGPPKTRSGKIMRRILRKIAEGEKSNFGDTSTLLDPCLVVDIVAKSV